MELVKQIKNFIEKIFLKVITLVSLTLTYFLGIGPTSVIGKIINKKFLSLAQESSWEKTNYKTDVRKMF
jgi:hypothetical protein